MAHIYCRMCGMPETNHPGWEGVLFVVDRLKDEMFAHGYTAVTITVMFNLTEPRTHQAGTRVGVRITQASPVLDMYGDPT